MTSSVGILAAFGAGLLSFLAPCTLALVPAYVSYLGGFTLTKAGDQGVGRFRVAAASNTVVFALGFMIVFVVLGASLGALSQTLASFSQWLNRIGDIFIIALGLVSLGLLLIPFLERGYQANVGSLQHLRLLGSFLVGCIFAIGWTPCVGPVLGAIFVLAGTSGTVSQGALLLASYATGMMLPFIAAGVMTGWTSWLLKRQSPWFEVANKGAGALLIVLGVVLFTGLMPVISSYFALGA